MNQAGVQADVRPPSRLRAPSYNLSSLLSIIPGSQILYRLRKGNSWFESSVALNLSELELEAPMSTGSMAEAAWPTAAEASSTLAAETAGEKVREYQQQIPAFPSPWEFFTSGYIAGLLIMTILLHRMQNVVIPSARRGRHGYHTPSQRTTLLGRLHAALLPLDFSRTGTRFVFHLPTVYYLSKVLVIWGILVLQTCEVQLVLGGDQKGAYVAVVQGRLEQLARWAMDLEMAQICWSTFCAVCGAFLMEGLVKALDRLGGSGGGFPIGGVNSVSPFHLVSYAFLLHIYSSPLAHGFHPADDSPSRPDKHVVITITIALLQLSMFHILSISKRLSTHRLIPTALSSILSLTHFHATLFSHITKAPNASATPTAMHLPTPRPTPRRTQRRPDNGHMAAGATYPLLNYVPNLFETTLLATILLTVTVNAITQLLVRGRIDHVFSGLGIFNGLPNDDGTHNGFLASLPYEEDFIIVLLRLGVASMEATGLRGWSNEVAPIQRPRIAPRKVWASRSSNSSGSRTEFGHSMEDTYGRVRIGRVAVAQVQYGSSTSSAVARTGAVALRSRGDGYEVKNRAAQWRRPQLLRAPRLRRGFDNDVRIIDLGHANRSGLFGGPWKRSVVAFWQFLVVFCGVIRGLVLCLLDRARRRVGDSRRESKGRQAVSEEREVEGDAESTTDEEETDAKVYQRFLRGEDISDDDEDAMEGSSTLSDDEEMSDETDEEKHLQEREGEVVDLFTDLLRNPDVRDGRTVPGAEQINSGSSGEMALAHLLHGSAVAPRPLTRHLWNTLTQQDTNLSFGDQQALESMSDRYYRGAEQRDTEKGFQHICVICMLESREIICWPCRCLAMCDGCRETLALKTPGSKHRCPCCRQIVDGYSKIYIP